MGLGFILDLFRRAEPDAAPSSSSEGLSVDEYSKRTEKPVEGSNESAGKQAAGEKQESNDSVEEQEEEEAECGFCLFMKSGPCGEEFVKWEECMDQAEKEEADSVKKCWPVTQFMKKCMQMNEEYYGVVLKAEQEMINNVKKQEEEDKDVEVAKQTEPLL